MWAMGHDTGDGPQCPVGGAGNEEFQCRFVISVSFTTVGAKAKAPMSDFLVCVAEVHEEVCDEAVDEALSSGSIFSQSPTQNSLD